MPELRHLRAHGFQTAACPACSPLLPAQASCPTGALHSFDCLPDWPNSHQQLRCTLRACCEAGEHRGACRPPHALVTDPLLLAQQSASLQDWDLADVPKDFSRFVRSAAAALNYKLLHCKEGYTEALLLVVRGAVARSQKRLAADVKATMQAAEARCRVMMQATDSATFADLVSHWLHADPQSPGQGEVVAQASQFATSVADSFWQVRWQVDAIDVLVDRVRAIKAVLSKLDAAPSGAAEAQDDAGDLSPAATAHVRAASAGLHPA